MTDDDVPRAESQSIASSVDPDEPPAESAMTESDTDTDTYGEIVNAQLSGDRIVYTAEHPDGSVIRGAIGRERGNAILSDTSMEQLREQLIGKKIEWPETFDPSSSSK